MNVIAYWLVPSQPAYGHVSRAIHELSTCFNAPEFSPHLTLFVAPEQSEPPAKVIDKVGNIDICLRVSGIDQSERFTKTLFVTFDQSEPLHHLCESVRFATSARAPCKLDPHLSLLYKMLPELTRKELVRSVRLPFPEISFDSLWAVRCPSPTETHDDVRSWRTVGRSGGQL